MAGAQPSCVVGPRLWLDVTLLGPCEGAGSSDDSRDKRRELFLVGITAHDADEVAGVDRGAGLDGWGVTHSGMFPCFFGGRLARFVRSARSARTTCRRVCDGSITAST